MERLCKSCQGEIIGKNKKAVFCSLKCKSKFNSDLSTMRNKNNPEFREYHRKKSIEWYANNHERQNKNMLKQYQKNKDKWRMRKCSFRAREDILKNKGNVCERCGSKKELELHHKEYINPPRGIRNRWYKKERIDFLCSIIEVLCKKCHNKITTNK